ncbi:FAD-binding monooxygenase [Nitzschia inconspicua]|uniref:FAD-binding monooxygenase n=1 Tax=Nitzschia inconspicua TaxID=303405 RepID=A0A9K3PQE9_9STRA|nr:FAD-binding monooxygenase [Nitzschia inconspicua]
MLSHQHLACFLMALAARWIDGVLAFSQTPSQQKMALQLDRSAPSDVKPVKRVCIVGAGIAGLSLAHALTNSPSLMEGISIPEGDLEVSIFDSRKSLDYTAGAGVQLNGGMACLGKINPDLQRAVIEGAIPISYIRGRHKSWSSKGDVDKLWDYSVEELIRSDERARQELLDDEGKALWYGIMRGALQEILLEKLPRSVQVSFDKTVTGISAPNNQIADGGAYCKFLDGSLEGPFDLIVGCDGIKSALKEYVDRENISEDPSKREGSAAALYSGIRIKYAVQENGGVENALPQPLQLCFADGGYALTGIYGNGKHRPPSRCFFVTSLDENYNGPFKRRIGNAVPEQQQTTSNVDSEEVLENADWSQNVRRPKAETREKMLQQIKIYGVSDSTAVSTVENADRFFELGVYFHNPINLSGWSKEVPSTGGSFTVLCGDAAHAMPPFLGQGANQAIQDAWSLATRLYEYNSKVGRAQLDKVSNDDEECERPSLKKELRLYQKTRFFPTASITVKATIIGYLETGGRNGFYAKFRDVFFKLLDFAGVPKRVLLDSSIPKV